MTDSRPTPRISRDPKRDPRQKEILDRNRTAYDAMAGRSKPLCRVAKPEEIANPLPAVDALGWLGDSIRGWEVLCLAAGGGRQSCLYAAAGARVTVVDLSPAMLDQDRRMAADLGLDVRVVETSMDDLSGLATGAFDLVAHPVSTCYLPNLQDVFAEVARVTRPGGLYVSQHKTPTSLQTTADRDPAGRYFLAHRYYRDAPVPPPKTPSPTAQRLRETGATEFLHRWEELVGGMCRAGFVIEDLVEPVHHDESVNPAAFADRARYVAPYVRIKARRTGDPTLSNPATSNPAKPSILIP